MSGATWRVSQTRKKGVAPTRLPGGRPPVLGRGCSVRVSRHLGCGPCQRRCSWLWAQSCREAEGQENKDALACDAAVSGVSRILSYSPECRPSSVAPLSRILLYIFTFREDLSTSKQVEEVNRESANRRVRGSGLCGLQCIPR